jgi:hypothetical protein
MVILKTRRNWNLNYWLAYLRISALWVDLDDEMIDELNKQELCGSSEDFIRQIIGSSGDGHCPASPVL